MRLQQAADLERVQPAPPQHPLGQRVQVQPVGGRLHAGPAGDLDDLPGRRRLRQRVVHLADELVRALPLLTDHRVRPERHPEDLPGDGEDAPPVPAALA
ncbi:hypothetical protein [Streptomyces sp. MJP52]|uniref:hypothetical protein n=1 Tax=Streptomyces sp. MJP52 TaxID=2940555 RepID=UPI002476EF39|nr:hypothetical protein [Streptomyces sp. MJP52]